jgi:toxin secretion/phage lysis holin
MKEFYCTLVGILGGFIAYLFGGWNAALSALVIFMTIDFISGLVVAGVFKKSSKTKNGALESKAGFKGICKKFMMLLLVAIGYRLDLLIDTTYIKDSVCIAFIANELISIIENAGIMGIPIPKVITNAIDVLKGKGDK